MRLAAVLLFVVMAAPAFAQSDTDATDEHRPFSYQTMQGTDLPGGDYRDLTNILEQDCEMSCTLDEACQGFTYNETASRCFLKSGIGQATPFEGAISARKVFDAASVAPAGEAEQVLEPIASQETPPSGIDVEGLPPLGASSLEMALWNLPVPKILLIAFVAMIAITITIGIRARRIVVFRTFSDLFVTASPILFMIVVGGIFLFLMPKEASADPVTYKATGALYQTIFLWSSGGWLSFVALRNFWVAIATNGLFIGLPIGILRLIYATTLSILLFVAILSTNSKGSTAAGAAIRVTVIGFLAWAVVNGARVVDRTGAGERLPQAQPQREPTLS